jgi:hypothetical protein
MAYEAYLSILQLNLDAEVLGHESHIAHFELVLHLGLESINVDQACSDTDLTILLADTCHALAV